MDVFCLGGGVLPSLLPIAPEACVEDLDSFLATVNIPIPREGIHNVRNSDNRALFVAGDGRLGDAVLVNAIIGAKRPGDYVDEAILEGHEALALGGYFARGRHVVSFVLWDMRYGSPLESILHGVIRQNMGATHHMSGRDHANVGDFFDPYAVRVLWTRGLPSYGIDECPHEVEGGLRIGAVLLGEFAYCPKYYGWTFLGGLGEGSLCGHVVEGFLALFCGGSLGGPSAACCGYAS